jgi:hypothetical protein
MVYCVANQKNMQQRAAIQGLPIILLAAGK